MKHCINVSINRDESALTDKRDVVEIENDWRQSFALYIHITGIDAFLGKAVLQIFFEVIGKALELSQLKLIDLRVRASFWIDQDSHHVPLVFNLLEPYCVRF